MSCPLRLRAETEILAKYGEGQSGSEPLMLMMSEGDSWSYNRKVLAQVFNSETQLTEFIWEHLKKRRYGTILVTRLAVEVLVPGTSYLENGHGEDAIHCFGASTDQLSAQLWVRLRKELRGKFAQLNVELAAKRSAQDRERAEKQKEERRELFRKLKREFSSEVELELE